MQLITVTLEKLEVVMYFFFDGSYTVLYTVVIEVEICLPLYVVFYKLVTNFNRSDGKLFSDCCICSNKMAGSFPVENLMTRSIQQI